MGAIVPSSKSGPPRWMGLWLIPIPVAWCLCAQLGWLAFLENKFVDWRFQWRGEADAPIKIVYVDIDSQSLSEIGGMPWSRTYFARVAQALIERAGVKAVGIDVVFSENGVAESVDWKKRVEGNRELAQFLATNPPVVVAASYAAAVDRDVNGNLVQRALPRVSVGQGLVPGDPPELPAFRVSEKNARQLWSPPLIGLIDTMDGSTRAVPAFAPAEARMYLHLSVELARLFYGVASDGVKIGATHIDMDRADGTHAAHIPIRDGQLLDVNWFSAWASERNPRISLSTVFNYAAMATSGTPEEKQTADTFFAQPELKGAIVLIGPADPLQQDLATTPFDPTPVPKVGVHGNLLKMIATGKYLRTLPNWHGIRWFDYALTLGFTGLVTGLATAGGARSRLTKLGAISLLLAYVAVGLGMFSAKHVILPMALPLGAALMTSFAAITYQLIREEKQKGRIKGMFGTYVSPQLVDRMIESGDDPQLGGHESEITAYFSDIQGFSAFSEKLESGPLVELMNEYLTACTDIVQEEGGTLDKYIGDAVVAMFGAPLALPDHAYRACVASQRVHQKIGELREKWKSEGTKWPDIVAQMQSRVGLNSGRATIGNMGSRTRFNYTMMGDNVNLAARMESGAKAYGVFTMVTETTKQACEQHGGDRVVFRFLDRIVVKGRSQPVPVYEIVGLKEFVEPQVRDCLQRFDEGMRNYLAKNWAAGAAAFRASAALESRRPGQEPGVETNPSIVMLERCEQMSRFPPEADWDGVYTMKEK
ncbi:MAG: adenylate/guanylate cyclase domain-containing protein [Opitutus sp.]